MELSEDLKTRAEAAEFLGVSETTLWRLCKPPKNQDNDGQSRPKLKCFRIGRRYYFSVREHLMPFLKESEENYAPSKA